MHSVAVLELIGLALCSQNTSEVWTQGVFWNKFNIVDYGGIGGHSYVFSCIDLGFEIPLHRVCFDALFMRAWRSV